MSTKTDHIIYAVPDLGAGMDWFEELTGVRPKFGGQHTGKGSHNALASLGNGVYLEIIAPDPEQPDPGLPRSFGIDNLQDAKLVTWAVNTSDIEQTVAEAQSAGYDPGQIVDGGRKRPDGVQMSWRSTRHPAAAAGQTPPGDWLIPFIIWWGETPHPSGANPEGATLIKLEMTHPNPDMIREMLKALALDISVSEGSHIEMRATLDTPKGTVILK